MFWSGDRYSYIERQRKERKTNIYFYFWRDCALGLHMANSLCQRVQCIWILSESSLKQRLNNLIWKHSCFTFWWWLGSWSHRIVCPAACPRQSSPITFTEVFSALLQLWGSPWRMWRYLSESIWIPWVFLYRVVWFLRSAFSLLIYRPLLLLQLSTYTCIALVLYYCKRLIMRAT